MPRYITTNDIESVSYQGLIRDERYAGVIASLKSNLENRGIEHTTDWDWDAHHYFSVGAGNMDEAVKTIERNRLALERVFNVKIPREKITVVEKKS